MPRSDDLLPEEALMGDSHDHDFGHQDFEVPKNCESGLDDYYELGEATVLWATSKAVRVEFDHEGETLQDWFPWSQVDWSSEILRGVRAGARGKFVISGWLARKRGWL